MTSHDVVDRVRRRFRYRKVGHAGTLDPMAEGVLLLGLGRSATKRLGRFLDCEKEYEVVMRLGVETDTQDAEGKIVDRRPCGGVDAARVEAAAQRFRGPQLQVPPMYSAVKRGGRPLYKLARRGKTVEREPRKIVVYELRVLGAEIPDVRLRVRCSKGTYIRTLCAEIGRELGCGAHCAKIVRTRVGEYTMERAMPLEELLEHSPAALAGRLDPPVTTGA